MRVAAALLLAALAAPALAQDRAAQYEAALDAFTLPTATDLGLGGLQEEEPVEALLPSLEGDWTHALVLFPGRGRWDDALVAESCERAATTLARTAPRSFEMRRTADRDDGPVTLTVRHDFVVGNTFARSADENEVLAYLGLADRELSAGALQMPTLRGEVTLFHPSPDILVFIAPGGAPEILARCP